MNAPEPVLATCPYCQKFHLDGLWLTGETNKYSKEVIGVLLKQRRIERNCPSCEIKLNEQAEAMELAL